MSLPTVEHRSSKFSWWRLAEASSLFKWTVAALRELSWSIQSVYFLITRAIQNTSTRTDSSWSHSEFLIPRSTAHSTLSVASMHHTRLVMNAHVTSKTPKAMTLTHLLCMTSDCTWPYTTKKKLVERETAVQTAHLLNKTDNAYR